MKPLCFFLMSILAATACAAPLKIELPAESPVFSSTPGVELVMQQCLSCHSAEYITTQPPLSRGGWKASVEKMQVKFGAQVPADKIEALVDYLARSYGPPVP